MGIRFTTAGESHGPGLVAIVEGLPAGLELDRGALDRDMARRQLGHGRGGRMKIESDSVEIRAGVRHGRTLGSPIAVLVANRDYENWDERMNPWPVNAEVEESHLPRPGRRPRPLTRSPAFRRRRVFPWRSGTWALTFLRRPALTPLAATWTPTST